MADTPIKLSDFSRRTFVKGAAATAAAAGLLGTSTWLAPENAQAAGDQGTEAVAYCWHKTHCQGACGLRCTVRDGRIALLAPNDKMPNKRYSKICLKGISEIQQVYSDERIQTPMRRVSERGENKFEPISWEEAFEDIYQNFKAIQNRYGKEAIWAHIASECSDMNWVANILGCYKTTGTDGADIGYGTGIDPATDFLGSTYAWATNGSRDWTNSELLLIVGTNFLETSLALSQTFFEAKEAGCRIVTVDPHFSTTARQSDEWVPIEPGTDMAMWLGMVSHVIDNELYDEDFMRKYTAFPYLVDAQTGKLLGEDTGEVTEKEIPIIDYKVWDSAEKQPQATRPQKHQPSKANIRWTARSTKRSSHCSRKTRSPTRSSGRQRRPTSPPTSWWGSAKRSSRRRPPSP